MHLPQPHRAVKPVHRQIRQLLGELQLDFQFVVLRLKLRQRRAEPQSSKAKGRGQADGTSGLVVALLQVRLKRLEIMQQLVRPFAQCLALGSGADVACGALEQAQPQAAFQRVQSLRDDRGHHVHCQRGSRKAAVLAHRKHQLQIAAFA